MERFLLVILVSVSVAASSAPDLMTSFSEAKELGILTESGEITALIDGAILAGPDGDLEEAVLSIAADPNAKKRKWGISAGFVDKYMKVRTAVRYTYDEIKLWQGVAQQYKDLVAYMGQMKRFLDGFADDLQGLFTTPGTFIQKLEQFVGIGDDLEYITTQMPQTLDKKIFNLERTIDTSLNRQSFTFQLGPWAHTQHGWTVGAIVPTNTAQAFEWLGDVTWNNRVVDGVANMWDSLGIGRERRQNVPPPRISDRIELPDGVVLSDTFSMEQVPRDDPNRAYTLPIMSNTILIASAVSNSNAYRMWAARTMQHGLDSLDRKLDAILSGQSGVNAYEFAASWYSIETVNANNKLLRHAVEEAKLLQALMGTDLHKRVQVREQELHHELAIRAFLGR